MGGLTAALFINAALCYIRFKYDGQGVKDDLKWILVIFLWVTSHSFLVDIPYLRKIAALLASCSAIFLPRLWSNADFISNSVGRQRATVSSVETPGQAPLRTLKPLLFPCRTSHTRIFPKKHSFSYSYLFVGIPIGWQGSSGYFISADVGGHSAESEWTKAFQQRQSSWFSVASTDHLNRGSHVLGLKGKLDEYLQSQVCKFPITRVYKILLRIYCLERRSKGLSFCLSNYRSTIPWLFFQSCVILVFIQ